METKHFSEKESLELITKMIQQTKENLQIGSGNIFLYYGYLAVIIASAVYFICKFTQNMQWHFLFFLMFVPMLWEKVFGRKRKPAVITYVDKAVANVWTVIGMLFLLSVILIIGLGYFLKIMPFTLMMPLSILYTTIGVSITGVITKEKTIIYCPFLGFAISIYMLIVTTTGGQPHLIWNVLTGLSFLITLVIPGHILNYKSRRACSKN